MRLTRFLVIAILGFLLLTIGPFTAQAETPTIEWIRQFGTSANDEGRDISVDLSGNVYVTGFTGGSLGGPNAGSHDAFLTKHNADGTLLWIRQFNTGINDAELGYGVTLDEAGNAYVTGNTIQFESGNTTSGTSDAFLAKFDPDGIKLWTRHYNYTGSSDSAHGVSVDSTGNAYITGNTSGNLGGTNSGSFDAFLTKFNPNGTELWTTQLGTIGGDAALDISVDANGNAYITGDTLGDLGSPNAGSSDAFLTKIDSNGTEIWTQQYGTNKSDNARGVYIHSDGNAYSTGMTWGSLGGPNSGSGDIFIAKITPEPASLSLLALGGLGLLRRRRRVV